MVVNLLKTREQFKVNWQREMEHVWAFPFGLARESQDIRNPFS
jgi:hypothetical protein